MADERGPGARAEGRKRHKISYRISEPNAFSRYASSTFFYVIDRSAGSTVPRAPKGDVSAVESTAIGSKRAGTGI
jgi:hypothetical protein